MELQIWGCTGKTLDALLAGEPMIDLRLYGGGMTINEYRARQGFQPRPEVVAPDDSHVL
jgi:hypothetical protein